VTDIDAAIEQLIRATDLAGAPAPSNPAGDPDLV
jgi:hypothetical protein